MNRFSSLPEGRSDGALQIASNPRTRRSGRRVTAWQLSETWPGPAWRRLREYGRWTEGVRKASAMHGR